MFHPLRLVLVPIGFLFAIPVIIRLILSFFTVGFKIFKVKERNTPPKCLSNPALGEHKYVSVNGVKLHYVESGPKDQPLLLFVHGFPEFWYSWRHQILHFNKNYHVVAFDMRGYNDSSKPEGISSYTMDILVEDVRALVTSLGVDKFHLVAHDWGAAVGWSFAALHPHMLKSYVVCNLPHVIALRDKQQSSWEQATKSTYIAFFQCPIIPELMLLSNDLVNLIRIIFKDFGGENDIETVEAWKYAFRDYKTWNRSLNYYRGILLNPEAKKFDKLLRNIKVPTLSIFGTADKALSVSAAQDSKKYVEDYQLELLDGISHWVQQHDPTRVNSLIQDFLLKH